MIYYFISSFRHFFSFMYFLVVKIKISKNFFLKHTFFSCKYKDFEELFLKTLVLLHLFFYHLNLALKFKKEAIFLDIWQTITGEGRYCFTPWG